VRQVKLGKLGTYGKRDRTLFAKVGLPRMIIPSGDKTKRYGINAAARWKVNSKWAGRATPWGAASKSGRGKKSDPRGKTFGKGKGEDGRDSPTPDGEKSRQLKGGKSGHVKGGAVN